MSATDLAFSLILASGMIHAVVNAILKSGRDKMAGRALIDGSSALFALPIALLSPLPHGAWSWLFGSAAIHLVYLYALVRAFQAADFSAAYPVARGTAPALTALLAIALLGETPKPLELAGIAAISGGVLAMSIGRHISREALGWSLLTGVCIAGYTVVDAAGVRAAPSALSYIGWSFLLLGIAIASMFAWLSGPGFVATVKDQWRPGVIAGGLSLVTYGFALTAYRLGATAPLAALRETSILFATLIAVVWLKERVTLVRGAAAGAIAAGAVLILSA
ncbi:MAG: DMT family transporter [Sphingomonadaceae bacterium]|nr:DMT family transporter [Sphingomonadaceae bacterium]